MVRTAAIYTAGAIIALSSAVPASSAAQPAEPSFIGTWTLDLASMGVPEEVRPASATVSFTPEGSDGIETRLVIVARDGSQRIAISHEKLDGRAVAIEGDRLEADSVALSSPTPGVLVMGLAKDGRPGSVRVYAVAPGGRTMTENAANVGDDGKPFIRTFRWIRSG